MGLINDLKKYLKSKFYMEDLETLKYFLEVEIVRKCKDLFKQKEVHTRNNRIRFNRIQPLIVQKDQSLDGC